MSPDGFVEPLSVGGPYRRIITREKALQARFSAVQNSRIPAREQSPEDIDFSPQLKNPLHQRLAPNLGSVAHGHYSGMGNPDFKWDTNSIPQSSLRWANLPNVQADHIPQLLGYAAHMTAMAGRAKMDAFVPENKAYEVNFGPPPKDLLSLVGSFNGNLRLSQQAWQALRDTSYFRESLAEFWQTTNRYKLSKADIDRIESAMAQYLPKEDPQSFPYRATAHLLAANQRYGEPKYIKNSFNVLTRAAIVQRFIRLKSEDRIIPVNVRPDAVGFQALPRSGLSSLAAEATDVLRRFDRFKSFDITSLSKREFFAMRDALHAMIEGGMQFFSVDFKSNWLKAKTEEDIAPQLKAVADGAMGSTLMKLAGALANMQPCTLYRYDTSNFIRKAISSGGVESYVVVVNTPVFTADSNALDLSDEVVNGNKSKSEVFSLINPELSDNLPEVAEIAVAELVKTIAYADEKEKAKIIAYIVERELRRVKVGFDKLTDEDTLLVFKLVSEYKSSLKDLGVERLATMIRFNSRDHVDFPQYLIQKKQPSTELKEDEEEF